MKLTAFTDGACAGNPGPGGWGVILVARDQHGNLLKEKELSGYALDTTNNQMELMAAISALEALEAPSNIMIKSDSKYVVEGITKWIINWKRRGWITKAKQPVKNEDLWRRLDALCQKHNVIWKWVKGHNGHKMNERADGLAVEQKIIACDILSNLAGKSEEVELIEAA